MDFTKLRNYLFLALLLLATIAFLFVIRPFAYPLFWAAVLAVLFHPFYRGLNKMLKRPNLSSVITLCLVTIIIIFPITITSGLLINESVSLYHSVNDQQGQIVTNLKDTINNINHSSFLTHLTHQGQLFDQVTITQKITEATNYLLNWTFNFAKDFTQNSVVFLVMFFITLYTFFYFLRDGERMLKKAMFLLPLGDKYETILYKKFTSTVRATIKGTLVIGLMQGVLGGALLAITGVPGAFIWGIIMVVLSILPATSSTLVLVPTGIIMLIMGNWVSGIVLIVGGFGISLLDNLIRPLIVGNDLQMHPVLILFSTLGGIVIFNVSGFIIGPIIAAIFITFWEMYEHYYSAELKRN